MRSFHHKCRMFIDLLLRCYIYCYYIYYDNKICGHVVVCRGGGRMKFCCKKDIIIGPIWVIPRYRGLGLATLSINIILNNIKLEYLNAYEIIYHENIASIKVAKKNNFVFVGNGVKKYSLIYCNFSSKSNMEIYKYKK